MNDHVLVVALGGALDAVFADVRQAAERNAFREQTDFIGRMMQAFCEVNDVCEQAGPDPRLTTDQVEQLEDGLLSVAALSLAWVARLRVECEACDGAEAERG